MSLSQSIQTRKLLYSMGKMQLICSLACLPLLLTEGHLSPLIPRLFNSFANNDSVESEPSKHVYSKTSPTNTSNTHHDILRLSYNYFPSIYPYYIPHAQLEYIPGLFCKRNTLTLNFFTCTTPISISDITPSTTSLFYTSTIRIYSSEHLQANTSPPMSCNPSSHSTYKRTT